MTQPQPNPRIPFALSTDLPKLPPFRGKRIVVNLAVNVEYWPFDRPMPRAVLPPPHGAQGPVPDVPNFTWVEYGLRAGMPRLLELCRHFGVPRLLALQRHHLHPLPAPRRGDAAGEVGVRRPRPVPALALRRGGRGGLDRREPGHHAQLLGPARARLARPGYGRDAALAGGAAAERHPLPARLAGRGRAGLDDGPRQARCSPCPTRSS